MKNIWAIVEKELRRFLGDSRMLFSILLPGILICIVYTLMGNILAGQSQAENNYQYQICTVNFPDAFLGLTEQKNIKIDEIPEAELNVTKEKLTNQEIDLLLVFSEDFDEKIANGDYRSENLQVPEISMYYNSLSNESIAIYTELYNAFDEYESTLANAFDLNAGNESYDLATEKEGAAKIFSMLIPMFMITFLFSGCLSVASESISGEKERSTIATLLMTPMKRSELALGKILGLSIIGLLSGLSSFIGIMISLPQLAKGLSANVSLSTNVYGFLDYVELLLIIIATVLFIVGMIAVISGFAKNTRETNMFATPIMIVVMVVSLIATYGQDKKTALGMYAIPIYNSAKCMNDIFSFSLTQSAMFLTVVTNIIYTLFFVYILTKMFDNEKIIYN